MNERREAPFQTADFVAGGERRKEETMQPVESSGGAQMVRESPPAALLSESETQPMRTRWNDIQASFVDEPRSAVQQADELVASVMKRLAEMFASERSNLEQQWDRGSEVSTEDLRQVLQRYRAFFNRLLSQ